MKRYTEKKFLSVTAMQQHKHAAALLRSFIEEDPNKVTEQKYYLELCTWLQLDSVDFTSLDILLDRYHLHLKLGKISLREDHLPLVLKGDLETPRAPKLSVDIFLQTPQ